jgi:hypothetical protein
MLCNNDKLLTTIDFMKTINIKEKLERKSDNPQNKRASASPK